MLLVPPRNSGDKLYQVCYDAVIQGVKHLHITQPPGDRATALAHNNDNTLRPARVALAPPLLPSASSATEHLPQSSPLSLPSPPPSPKQAKSPASSRPIPMDRNKLHGAPPPGGQPRYGTQDARANLAVQPAAAPAKIRLKKAAVKIVPPGAALPTAPVAAPVSSEPKAEDGQEPPKPAIKVELDATPTKPTFTFAETQSSNDAESALDTMFARLNSPLSASGGPDKAIFTFEEKPAKLTAAAVLESYTASPPTEMATKSPHALPMTPAVAKTLREEEISKPSTNDKVKEVKKLAAAEKALERKGMDNARNEMSKEDLHHEYLGKASEYLNSLPTGGKAVTADLIKRVAIKLRRPYTPATKLESGAVESLKSRYLNAVATYCNGLGKPGKEVTTNFVEQALKKGDGDFLQLCATLVDEKILVIDNLDEVAGLCKAVIEIVPEDVKPEAAASVAGAKPISKDPMDKMTSWPTQVKRENVAECRTCILKGVSGFTSINQLQALVWGGRLESISMPEPDSGYALVKFLTAAACSKYFDATENGIEVPGQKRTVVFVEKQPGPNSINDVIRNCIDGDASRCVRALDAEEDWSDMLLLKLAKGTGQMKREVDRIKRGKTSRGRYYIEFRFSNIYHALNFKRSLVDDIDWEHCTIGYAPDPCETAHGVHFKDEDEDPSETAFFA